MSGPAVPAGFHEHASGLIVPEAHARKRIVVPEDDWKRIDRALNVLNRLDLRFQFRCELPKCSGIEKVRTPDGGTVLRCDHADRVFTKAF